MKFRTEDAKSAHLWEMIWNIRDVERARIEVGGETARRFLRRAWMESVVCRAVLIDGKLTALWGLYGTTLGTDGALWCFTTPAIERLSPLALVRMVRRELAAELASRHKLTALVLEAEGGIVRLAQACGFVADATMTTDVTGASLRLLTIGKG